MKINYSNEPKNNFPTNKKQLIYLCSFGQDYFDMAKMLIWSIRNMGNFSDNIVVLVDPETFEKNQNFSDVQLVKFDQSVQNPQLTKVLAKDYIGWEKYEQVLYLDTDILVVNNLAPIFSMAQNKILCFEDVFPLERWWFAWKKDMPPDLAKKLGVNSGIFCGKSKNMSSLLNHWQQEHNDLVKSLNVPHDQPAFNKIVFEHLEQFQIVPNIENIEKYTHIVPTRRATRWCLNQGNEKVCHNTTFLHFIWMKQRPKLEKMKKVFDTLKQDGKENIGNITYYEKVWKW